MPAIFLTRPPYIVEVGKLPGVYFSREDYETRVAENPSSQPEKLKKFGSGISPPQTTESQS